MRQRHCRRVLVSSLLSLDPDAFIKSLRKSAWVTTQIEHIEQISEREPQFGALNRPLHPDLDLALQRLEIRRLYSHQAEAVNAAREGRDVVTVTSTASGKTLCYNLPVLDIILSEPQSRALYLFPTRALAQDQTGKLNDFDLFPKVKHAAYDGDTPQAERRAIRKLAQVVLTNPDMLHLGILPYHQTWGMFFANLKFVVLDEVHTYRGVFGAHVAQVLRRLRRICTIYGSDPKFLCCSATIANPESLIAQLTGVGVPHLVNSNGSPSGRRTFMFWNPPRLESHETQRRSANSEASQLLAVLTANGVRSITFARTRKTAELLLRSSRSLLEAHAPHLVNRIASYRAGYTRKERRELEKALFSGELLAVTATSALELGVDIGGLDASILTGYPGTIASAWQQAGRAGRSGGRALTIMIAYDNPLDQFLMRHPDYFFGRPHEIATADCDNRRILQQHLLCAAYECPVSPPDMQMFGVNARQCLQNLREEGHLFLRNGRLHCNTGVYPAALVNLRSAESTVYQIVHHETRTLIGTAEYGAALRTLHPGAIYLHQGETFRVEELNHEALEARVIPAEVSYYTEPAQRSSLLVLGMRHQLSLGAFGDVVVTSRVVSYQRKRLQNNIVLDVTSLDMPEQTFETEAVWLAVSSSICDKVTTGGYDIHGSLHAVEHALAGMIPLLIACDRSDIGGITALHHPDTGAPTIFLFDTYPGGVGIAEGLVERMPELMSAALQVIEECPCDDGCPSCVHSPLCGVGNHPLDKPGSALLLSLLLANMSSAPIPVVSCGRRSDAAD